MNLDLTSHHGPLRPPRRRQEDASSRHESASAADDSRDTNSIVDPMTPIEGTEGDTLNDERIQVLGLHTCNPIVSYHNQIFSCSWADQIGTELVFAHPDADPETDHRFTPPLYQGPAFELLAANNVKILGRRANITSSSGPGLAQDAAFQTNFDAPGQAVSSSQMPEAAGVPRRPEAPTYQAQFIQRLQNLKAQNGETDTVRTVMSTRRNLNITERLKAWARTEAQIAYVNDINKRASEGDEEALHALERLLRELPPG